MTQHTFQHESAGNWADVDPGVKRMIMGFNETLMMVKVKFEKNAVGSLHSHPHIQVSYIAKGRFDVTIGDITRQMSEGDSFFVQPNLVHGVVCLEDGLLVDIFHPFREDFL